MGGDLPGGSPSAQTRRAHWISPGETLLVFGRAAKDPFRNGSSRPTFEHQEENTRFIWLSDAPRVCQSQFIVFPTISFLMGHEVQSRHNHFPLQVFLEKVLQAQTSLEGTLAITLFCDP